MECDSAKAVKYYNTVSCVFAADRFYASIQADDGVKSLDYDFENDARWKAMDSESLKKLTAWNYQITLKTVRGDTNRIAEQIEESIRSYISEYRMNTMGIQTSFDESLSYMLAPALANYETERVCGFTVGDEEFESAIIRAIPDKHTFKACPVHTQGVDAKKIFVGLIQNKVGKEILNAKGDFIRFAVRTKVVDYPEYVTSTWTVIAVRYHSIR
eukprot:TRINITY_DN1716_c0_g1_i5.p3 TRINITY_DN1716_c0_g1~~TRINITY_DN1716_c0_g1_i5.p3  ORF type:complete len:214 (+),score=28.14 TRINITY_DN1716_c0_g1_i5:1162-1803(+)